MRSLDVLKHALRRYFPSAAALYDATQIRKQFKRRLLARQIRHKALIYGDRVPTVLSGPFAGMRYLDEIVWGPIEPKWLGTYESELIPVLYKILSSKYAIIIDVGSAEGFYAIGLATRLPDTKIYSYDTDFWARRQQARLAALNNVRNVEIGGLCSNAELKQRIASNTLLVCDIEGFEYGLLDPSVTPELLTCDILVELHDWGDGAFTTESGKDELAARFQPSHDITIIRLSPRDVSLTDGVVPERLTASERADCMDEMRWMEQIWMWMERHARGLSRA